MRRHLHRFEHSDLLAYPHRRIVDRTTHDADVVRLERR
jgi:hypothetical protein